MNHAKKNYFQKYSDIFNNGSYINCYNNLENYYLNKTNNILYPCYYSCKECNKSGDNINNNCINCISSYEFKNDNYKNNNNNCYKICDFYYYYDSSNKYNCTDDFSCP